MTETSYLVRRLFDRITVDGRLTDDAWREFKRQHGVTPEQAEAVLLATVGHVLVLANEIQAEANRLSVALQRRG